MKTLLTVTLLTTLYSASYGQTKECSSMEVLKRQQQEDPTLKQRMDSLELVKQNYLKSSGKYEDNSQFSIPLIPGFIPTGDHETDLKNFAIAKQELYANDPELYKKLTRSESNSKNKRK